MNFVQKKATEAQINKVGKDLGLGSKMTSGFSGGSSDQPRNPKWSAFSLGEDGDLQEPQADDGPSVLPAISNDYESMPNNFPPVLCLFYVDQSILSQAAEKPVSWAYVVLCGTEVALFFNTFVAALFTALEHGGDWYFLLISAALTLLLSFYQLFAFEIAFRGAYQTLTGIRKQYLYLSAINILPMTLYAFLGVAFFHGWSRIGYIDETNDINNPGVRKAFAFIEALLWTSLLFTNIYSLFTYYHLVKGREQGLSPEAIAKASRAKEGGISSSNTALAPQHGTSKVKEERPSDSRIQEMRERYGTDEPNLLTADSERRTTP